MFPQDNNGMAVMDTTNTLIGFKVDLQEIAIGYFKLSKTLWLGKAQFSKEATDILLNGYSVPLKSTSKHF